MQELLSTLELLFIFRLRNRPGPLFLSAVTNFNGDREIKIHHAEIRHASPNWRVNDAASCCLQKVTHLLSLSPLHIVKPLETRGPANMADQGSHEDNNCTQLLERYVSCIFWMNEAFLFTTRGQIWFLCLYCWLRLVLWIFENEFRFLSLTFPGMPLTASLNIFYLAFLYMFVCFPCYSNYSAAVMTVSVCLFCFFRCTSVWGCRLQCANNLTAQVNHMDSKICVFFITIGAHH